MFGHPLIKWLEFWIASYLLATGYFFLTDETFMTAKVYQPWQQAGVGFWGALTIFISLLHFGALWVNGHLRRSSRVIRALACLLHFYLAVQFAFFFIAGGAPWGALTMLFVLIPLLLPVLCSTIDDVKVAFADARTIRPY